MAKKESEPFPEEGTAEFDEFVKQAGTEVEVPKQVTLNLPGGNAVGFTAEQLKQLSFADVEQMEIVTADEALGKDQFGPILEDKGKLVGVPFVAVYWQFNDGDFGDFVTMYVLTQNEDRYIVNDGSTGIAAQLSSMTDTEGINSMLVCKHGLRVSEYEKELDNGKKTHAKTYYIDTKL